MSNATRSLLIVVAAGAAAFLALKMRESGEGANYEFEAEAPGVFDSPLEFAREIFTELTMNNAEALQHPNVQAVLRLIRKGEGTADDRGYSRLVGGGQFNGFNDHPRQRVHLPRLNIYSTAAGAYQILERTWEEVRRAASLIDFTPSSQDLAAVQLLRRRNALADVLGGRIEAALEKISWEWASLPPYRYSGQGTLRLADAKAYFVTAGGLIGDIA